MTGSENETKLSYHNSGTSSVVSQNDNSLVAGSHNITHRQGDGTSDTNDCIKTAKLEDSFSGTYNNSDAATTFIGAKDSSSGDLLGIFTKL